MLFRNYNEKDLNEIIELFYQTVNDVNSRDYTPEQIKAWIGGIRYNDWNKSMLENFTVVAVDEHAKIVGFGDIEKTGYLNRLYVYKNYQRQHIATKICNILEQHVPDKTITAYASKTALPFFFAKRLYFSTGKYSEKKWV